MAPTAKWGASVPSVSRLWSLAVTPRSAPLFPSAQRRLDHLMRRWLGPLLRRRPTVADAAHHVGALRRSRHGRLPPTTLRAHLSPSQSFSSPSLNPRRRPHTSPLPRLRR